MHNLLFCLACGLVSALAGLGVRFNSLLTVSLVLAAVCLIGVPHGGLDHLTGRKHLVSRWGSCWVIPFFGAYLAVAVLTVFGWLFNPLVTAIAFFLVSAWHFGQEDEAAGPSTTPLRTMFFIASGGLAIWIPSIARPIEMQRILDGIIPESISISGGLIVGWTQAIAVVCIPLALADVLIPFCSRLPLKRESWRRALRQIVLVVVFALAPIPVSFALYFCGWHSIQGLRELMKEHNMKLGELAVATLPMSLGALGLIGIGMWFWNSNRELSVELTRTMFIGLSAIAVPHLALHSLTKQWSLHSQEAPSRIGGLA